MTVRIHPGQPYPLGATWDGSGVNFAIFSENAEAVELCLFDQAYGAPETVRIRMSEQLLAIIGQLKRGAALQLLQRLTLLGPRKPQSQRLSGF